MSELLDLMRERGFATLYHEHPDGVYLLSCDGKFVTANHSFEVMTGLAFEEVDGRSSEELVDHSFVHRAQQEFRRALTGEVVRFVSRSRLIGGSAYYIDVTNIPLRNEIDEVVGILGIVRDVSEFQIALEQIDATSSTAQFARDFAGIAGWSVDVEQMTLRFSTETFAMLNIEGVSDVPLDESWVFYEEPHRTRVRRAVERCIDEGREIDLEAEVLTANAEVVPIHVVGRAVRGDDGRIVRVDGIIHDQRPLLEHRAEIADLEHRLSQSFNEIDVPVFHVLSDGKVSFVNTAGRHLVGLSLKEILHHSLWDVFPFLRGSAFEASVEHAIENGVESEATDYVEVFDRWFETKIHPTHDGVMMYVYDVTDSQLASRRAAASHQRATKLAKAIDLANDVIMFRDLDGSITYWNAAAERLYGWRFDEVVGKQLADFLFDEPEASRVAREQTLREGMWRGEIDQRTRDGRAVTVDATWQIIRDDAGRPTEMFGIMTDVTDRRRELERRVRNQRMESLGTLAGGIAHDLNNVLTPVLMSLDLLRVRSDDTRTLELVTSMEKSVRRGADLLRQVLTFARGVDGEREVLAMETLLEDVMQFCHETLPRNIGVTLNLQEQLWPIVGDATQIMQVLINLVTNARDAMPNGGTLEIRVSNIVTDGLRARAATSPLEGRYLHIEVIDTGEGMDAVTRAKIFEPFFTTKAVGEGTGLGLSTSRAIVRSHGGGLDVVSAKGAGTTISVFLPASTQAVVTEPSDTPSRAVIEPHDTARILLADDEEPIAELLSLVLRSDGYDVVTAPDGVAALELAKESAPFDLLISDIHMPGLDGSTLARQLKESNPKMRVILMSGLAVENAPYDDSVGEFFPLLRKPFDVEAFLSAVRATLAR